MMYDRELEAHALFLTLNNKQINLKSEYFFFDEYRNLFELYQNEKVNLFDSRVEKKIRNEILDNNTDWFLLDEKGTRKNLIDFYNKRQVQNLSQNLMRDLNVDYKQHLLKFELEQSTEVKESDLDLDLENTYINVAKIHGSNKLGVRTGIQAIDNLVYDIDKGDYVLIGARPSIGKSVLGKDIADYNLRCKRKTMIFSLEMTKEMYFRRWIFSIARINQNFFKSKQLTKGHFEMLDRAKEEIKLFKGLLKLFDEPCNIYDIEEKVRKFKPEVVVIDYLQYIKAHMKNDRRIIIEDISQRLKELAKQTGTVIFVISSLNRAQKGSENKPPHMSDLKESSNLEFDADEIILLHRESIDGVYEDTMKAIITKCRNGSTGLAECKFNGGISKIERL